MLNQIKRKTSKGVAVITERVILIEKKLFNNEDEANAYILSTTMEEIARRGRTRNVKREDVQTQSPETQSS